MSSGQDMQQSLFLQPQSPQWQTAIWQALTWHAVNLCAIGESISLRQGVSCRLFMHAAKPMPSHKLYRARLSFVALTGAVSVSYTTQISHVTISYCWYDLTYWFIHYNIQLFLQYVDAIGLAWNADTTLVKEKHDHHGRRML